LLRLLRLQQQLIRLRLLHLMKHLN
jgi:hypothetical protein